MHILKLNRLSEGSIGALSESMLGPVGRQKQVVDLLRRETEGNVFFLIEVVRALAEETGQLDKIGLTNLPERVFAGGIHLIIQRRLNRVPPADYPLLEIAAVAGRQIDLNLMPALMRAVHTEIQLDKWLTDCSDAAVLDVQNERWQFAHDKLREGLLRELPEDKMRLLHRHVAEAIEAFYPNAPEKSAALSYHWSQAGEHLKECYYAGIAGEVALHTGAHEQAITFLKRALTLDAQFRADATDKMQRAQWEQEIGVAYYGAGSMADSREHLENALELLGWQMPTRNNQLLLGILGQVLKQIAHRLRPNHFLNTARANREKIVLAARAFERITQVAYIDNDTLRTGYGALYALNLNELAGPSSDLARSYANTCIACSLIPLHGAARSYAQRAYDMAENVHDPLTRGYTQLARGVYGLGIGNWAEAQKDFEEGGAVARRFGDGRQRDEHAMNYSSLHYMLAQFERSQTLAIELYEASTRRGDVQIQGWSLLRQAGNLMPLGRFTEAEKILDQALITLKDYLNRGGIEEIWTYGVLAGIRMRQEHWQDARQAAERVAEIAAKTNPTLYAMLDAYSPVAELYLTLWETEYGHPEDMRRAAKQACKALHQFARTFSYGKARALLHQGTYHWLEGKQATARQTWTASIVAAQDIRLPYEAALTHYEMGRRLTPTDPMRHTHLEHAQTIFADVGSAYYLERTRIELEHL
jgi:tetratricopeptide (TPR) repeat protein